MCVLQAATWSLPTRMNDQLSVSIMKRPITGLRRQRLLQTILIVLLMTLMAAMALSSQVVTALEGPPRESLDSLINGPGAEILPIISVDGRTLYFDRKFDSSNLGGSEDEDDIWVSVRSKEGGWLPARNIGAPLNGPGSSTLFWVSADGDQALVHSSRIPGTGLGLSQRVGDVWQPLRPIIIDDLSSLGETYYATITPDMRRIIVALAPDSTNPENLDLYIATLASPGLQRWSRPIPLSSVINTGEFEGAPFMAPDNRTLYFSSSRIGGYGKSDIYMSRRIGESWGIWSEPVNLGPRVNTPGLEESFSMPAFDAWGYVSSYGPYGRTDIFRVRVADDMLPEKAVIVRGRFAIGERGVVGLVRAIREQDGVEVASITSGSDGSFTLILLPGNLYNVVGWSPESGEAISRVDARAIPQGALDCILRGAVERDPNGTGSP